MQNLKASNPVFIIGSERSGTNLLRTLLSNHSHLYAPLSPHFIQEFGRVCRFYAPLSNKVNARHLFDDMLALANHPYSNWSLELSFDHAWEKYRPSCFLDYFSLLYLEAAYKAGKAAYVCKEINIWDHIFNILNYFDNPRFLYLYRDPRDCAASWMAKPMFIRTAYDAVNNWCYEQDIVAELRGVHGVDMHPVKYEELVAEPARIMRGVLEYIRAAVESQCFDTIGEKSEGMSWNPYWENLFRPVNADSTGRYREILHGGTIKMVETIAKHNMQSLGYSLETNADWISPRHMKFINSARRLIVLARKRRHIYGRMSLLHSKVSLIRRLQINARQRFRATRSQ